MDPDSTAGYELRLSDRKISWLPKLRSATLFVVCYFETADHRSSFTQRLKRNDEFKTRTYKEKTHKNG